MGSPPSPNPLQVSVNLDNQTSSTTTIGNVGGTARLDLTDGSMAVLEIPPGAVLSDVDVVMTEVHQVGGLPFARGFLRAVHLQPEGLRLAQPAILRLLPPQGQPATPPPGSISSGFAYRGLGDEFHLYPLRQGSPLSHEVELMHFSGYGVVHATQAELDRQREDHPPSSAEDQANQTRDPANSQAQTYESLYWWYRSNKSDAGFAEFDADRLDHAYFQYETWFNSVLESDMFGLFTDEDLRLRQSLARALVSSVTKAYLKCTNENDLSQIPRIVRWYHWATSRPTIAAHIPNLRELGDRATSCLEFDLEFVSLIKTAQAEGDVITRLEATVPVSLITGILLPYFEGDASSEYTDTYWPGHPDCTISLSGTGAQFRVTGLDLDLNPHNPVAFTGLKMWIVPGNPTERLIMNCPDAVPVDAEVSFWSGGWERLHQEELETVRGGGYRIEQWFPGILPSEIAVKNYKRRSLDGLYFEDTLISLRHTQR